MDNRSLLNKVNRYPV